MSRVRTIFCPLASAALAASVVACGGSATNDFAVRIGARDIDMGTVAHWISIMAIDRIAPQPPRYSACINHQKALEPQRSVAVIKQECREAFREARERALDYLISSQWLIAEAEERGLGVSRQAVQRRLEEEPSPRASGLTVTEAADTRLAAEAELAETKIRQAVIDNVPPITQAKIAAYYKRNIQRYGHREVRYIDIVEGFSSEAAARSAMTNVTRGQPSSHVALHETVEKQDLSHDLGWKKGLDRAIFAAKRNVLSGPVSFGREWAFFVVKRVVPASVKPLARVQRSITRRLAREQQRGALSAFIAAWRRKWIARTDCSPAYVVQKCRQYRDGRALEEALAFN